MPLSAVPPEARGVHGEVQGPEPVSKALHPKLPGRLGMDEDTDGHVPAPGPGRLGAAAEVSGDGSDAAEL